MPPTYLFPPTSDKLIALLFRILNINFPVPPSCVYQFHRQLRLHQGPGYGPLFIRFSDRSALQLAVFIGSLGPFVWNALVILTNSARASIPAFVPKAGSLGFLRLL